MKYIILSLFLFLSACGGGTSEPAPKLTSPIHIIVSGDSITLQGGNGILSHVLNTRPGSTMENRGRNAQRAQEMIDGTYGSLPDLNKEHVYVFSFGTNEFLQGRTVQEYIASMEDMLVRFKGYKVVLEAPWLVVAPGCNCYGGGNTIVQFRDGLVALGAKYKVPVAPLEYSLENTDTIHLTGKHMDERAALVAKTILENY